MARNATFLLDRKNGYKASVDASGNINGSGLTGTYIQFGNLRLYGFSTAITGNTTTTSAPAGSIAFTSNATGQGVLFYSDGTKWQRGTAEDVTA
jgi:hypothetical protein